MDALQCNIPSLRHKTSNLLIFAQISEQDFACLLLRYTDLTEEVTYQNYTNNVDYTLHCVIKLFGEVLFMFS